jgi:hypothetical protein
MKKVIVIIVIGVFLSLGFSSSAVCARGFRGHGGGHFHRFGGPHVFIGGYFGLPHYYPYGYPYYSPYPYPYPYAFPYYPPYAETRPPVYIEPQQSSSWYYCQDPQGYYPYVESCPGGWTRVNPTPPPPGREGTVR